MGNWPQFSYPNSKIITKLNTWGGNNSPMPYASGKGGVSGLMPWIRVISAYGCKEANSAYNGLIMQSNYPEDGFNIRYGNAAAGSQTAESGICGFELDYKTPVRVKGRPTRPAPIISALSVSEVDIGRKTTNFSITCYTLEHMEKLAKYFLEPGFYVLVEWGWNTRDARKQWVGNPDTGAITPCDIAKYINIGYIKGKREKSNFEYDASLGLTTNGGVKFGDNETFILDVQLTSQGEVAEYMQGHKGGSPNTTKNVSSERFDPAKIDEAANKDGVAKALFRQMFNDLNASKQTGEIKGWEEQHISDKKKDYAFIEWGKPNLDNKWADESNYINMDKVIQTKILSALKELSSVQAGGEEDAVDFEFPEDKPLLSSERFIRFELACAIMNEDFTDKSSKADSPKDICTDNKASLVVNIDTCICGAHPHMFSLDKNTLYIPNPTAPSFNIDSAFSGQSADVKFIDIENLDANTQNLHPTPTAGISYTGTREKNGSDTPHAFPSQYALTEEDNKWKDESIKSYECPKAYWGWLKNLYINFDFFCKVMKTPNYTIRDVLYELLNGMSSAVNSHWRFQIVERHHPNTEKTELHVVDLNFSGVIKHDENRIPSFQLRGLKSPFIDVDFNVTTPAAMQNSVLQQRASNDIKASVGSEFGGLVPVAGSVWSNPNSTDGDNITPIDPVATIVSGIKFKEPATKNEETTASESQQKDADAIRSANYQFFVGKAGVFPKNQNRNDMEGVISSIDDGNIQDVFMVGTFDDSVALRQVYLKDIDSEGWREPSNPNYGKANTPFGMAEVNFTVHGMSGFKRGDTMRFEGLPKNFSYPHTYEVTGLEHDITTNGWYTKVKTGMRPYGANTAAKK